MSMMRSNITSAISEPIILGFKLSGLSRVQELLACDHESRTYGSPISLVQIVDIQLKNSPVRNL